MTNDTFEQPRTAARKRKTWAIGVGVAVLSIAGVAAAINARPKHKDGDNAPVALQFLPQEVVQPASAPLPERIAFSGPLMAPRTAIIRAKAAGTLLSLAVAEGSRVRAGETLGAIDLADLQSRVAERSAGVESAQARLVEAERSHAANENLSQQHFISPTALATSRANLDAARAQVKSMQAQLATSQISVRSAALTAPIAGIVGKRSVVPGERVAAEQELLTVVDLQSLELAGVVGTHQVARLRPGQPVAVQVEGQDTPVQGRIDRIAPVAETGSRGIRVVVVLANPGEVFRAGQYASAEVVIPDAAERTTVPIGAVRQDSGQDFVWTLQRGALVRRIVITGRRDEATGRIEIQRGLPPGAQVLAASFDNLREGAPARIVAQRASDAAPGGAASASAPARS